MFKQFRPLVKIASELRRIATALEYFAIVDARMNNRMFIPAGRVKSTKDESELLHTDEAFIIRARAEEAALINQRGYEALSYEDIDEQ